MNDKIDNAASQLPDEIAPTRDLWPQIEARLQGELPGIAPVDTPQAPEEDAPPVWRAAAAVLVLAAAAVAAVTILRPPPGPPETVNTGPAAVEPATTPAAVPDDTDSGAYPMMAGTAPADDAERVGPQLLPVDYIVARSELVAGLEETLAELSPHTRAIVESNLAEIQSALTAIDTALQNDPGNQSLQQLLVSTSSQELRYMSEIQRLTKTATMQEREL